MRWTNIKKGVPPYGAEVLVSDGKEVGHAKRTHTDRHGEHFDTVGCDSVEWLNVIEWMRMPQPTVKRKKSEHRFGNIA